jgi:nucleoside-diphosphate-sugar epimerase
MRVFVTGGSGFVGSKVAQMLLSENYEVTLLARKPIPKLQNLGAKLILGDVCDFYSLKSATRDVDAVIHCAAKAGIWGPERDFLKINYEGTKKLVHASEMNNVKYFIYTSTSGVVYNGKDLINVDETTPYLESSISSYGTSKMLAEKFVLSHNKETFKTLSLRPHIVWGPGDPHFLPRIFALRKANKIRTLKGGPYLFDSIYIDNIAECHVHALKKLDEGAKIAGEAFFVTQNEPLDSRDFVNMLLECGNLPPVKPSINPNLCLFMAHIVESLWKLFRVKSEPPITVYVAKQFMTNYYFNLYKTTNLLGFTPKISLTEGFKRLKAHLNP